MNKTYLVTGAAGFIGSALAQKILEMGHSVVTVDNLSTGNKSNIPKDVELIEGDCQSALTINKLRGYKFEAIFHIAGQSSGEISFENPIYDLQTNTQSTLLLLKLCEEVGCSDFIYASSMSVYGDHDKLPVSENDSCKPKSFYAVGKLASENYLKIYANKNLKTTALRFFNAYGPGQNLTNMKQGMVSIFLSMALKSNEINIKGDANRFRDFIYIDDLINGIWSSLNRKGFNFEAINLSSGTKTTVKEVVKCIDNNISSDILINYSKGTPGDQFGIYGSTEYAFELLGWKSETNFIDGMKEMVHWAKEHLNE